MSGAGGEEVCGGGKGREREAAVEDGYELRLFNEPFI